MPGSLHTPTFVHGRVLVVAPVRRGSQGITATDTLETRAVLTTHDLDSTQSVADAGVSLAERSLHPVEEIDRRVASHETENGAPLSRDTPSWARAGDSPGGL